MNMNEWISRPLLLECLLGFLWFEQTLWRYVEILVDWEWKTVSNQGKIVQKQVKKLAKIYFWYDQNFSLERWLSNWQWTLWTSDGKSAIIKIPYIVFFFIWLIKCIGPFLSTVPHAQTHSFSSRPIVHVFSGERNRIKSGTFWPWGMSTNNCTNHWAEDEVFKLWLLCHLSAINEW